MDVPVLVSKNNYPEKQFLRGEVSAKLQKSFDRVQQAVAQSQFAGKLDLLLIPTKYFDHGEAPNSPSNRDKVLVSLWGRVPPGERSEINQFLERLSIDLPGRFFATANGIATSSQEILVGPEFCWPANAVLPQRPSPVISLLAMT